MAEHKSWDELEKELAAFEADAGYRIVRPLLETARSLIGAQQQPQVAQDFLVIAQKLKKDVETEAFNQPGWRVDNVINASNVTVNLGIAPLRIALEEIAKQLQPKLQSIPVDVVPVIMTASEAAELATGAAFGPSQQTLQQDFVQLISCLSGLGLTKWAPHYGARREDWRPFEDQALIGPTIGEHIATRLADIKQNDSLPKDLTPIFHDIALLSTGGPVLKRLRSAGCLVLIDGVSLRHPQLLAAFQRTLLDVYPRSSVFAFAPGQPAYALLDNMTHAMQLPLRDSELRRRMEDPYQEFRCIQIIATTEPSFGWALVDSVRKLYHGQVGLGGTSQHFNRT